MNKIVKLGFTLGIYAAISCCLLAVVNNFTSPVIAQHEAEKENQSLKIVIPATKYIPASEQELSNAIANCGIEVSPIVISKIYKAVDNSEQTLGYAANITGPTFEKSTILLGMDSQMMITGVNILKTTDTPGAQKLSDYRTKKVTQNKTWTAQFEGVYPMESFEVDRDYEIISGATLSSGGIATMIKTGASVIKSYANANK